MDKFLEKHNYQINTRKTENPNSPVSTKEVEFVIKEHFQKEDSRLRLFYW